MSEDGRASVVLRNPILARNRSPCSAHLPSRMELSHSPSNKHLHVSYICSCMALIAMASSRLLRPFFSALILSVLLILISVLPHPWACYVYLDSPTTLPRKSKLPQRLSIPGLHQLSMLSRIPGRIHRRKMFPLEHPRHPFQMTDLSICRFGSSF
jgi:hypothetical protein